MMMKEDCLAAQLMVSSRGDVRVILSEFWQRILLPSNPLTQTHAVLGPNGAHRRSARALALPRVHGQPRLHINVQTYHGEQGGAGVAKRRVGEAASPVGLTLVGWGSCCGADVC